MTTYALVLSYDGRPFAGWQRQSNAVAVQEVVETALAALLGRAVRIEGASRTDTGVHARAQVAHLELGEPFPESALVHGTNARLPESVRVLAVHRVRDGFHARKHARAKEYRYRLLEAAVLSPLDAPTALRLAPEPGLDRELLRAAAGVLAGRHDFSAFALTGGSHRQPFRTIFAAEWLEAGPELVFRVIGDGFLRGMVRGVVGTLLEVGRGKRSPAELAALLAGAPRAAAGPTAPAHALVLHEVFYGPEEGVPGAVLPYPFPP